MVVLHWFMINMSTFLQWSGQGSGFAWASLNCHYSLHSNSSFTLLTFVGAPPFFVRHFSVISICLWKKKRFCLRNFIFIFSKLICVSISIGGLITYHEVSTTFDHAQKNHYSCCWLKWNIKSDPDCKFVLIWLSSTKII